jgi:hypothetical protein
MQTDSVRETSVFNERQLSILRQAFEEALRMNEIKDRSDIRAQTIARRIISSYALGERDPINLACTASRN